MSKAMQGISILKEAFNLLFDDSEEDGSIEEIKVFKSPLKCGRFHKTSSPQLKSKTLGSDFIPRLTDKSFKRYFRVDPNVFELICKELQPFLYKKYGPGRNPVKLDRQLMITLWYLGNTEGLRLVAQRFGVCSATSWRVIQEVLETLNKLNEQKHFVRWPTTQEAEKTAEYYESTYKIKGVIGCIDSCHILIRAPINRPKKYMRREKHCILLQAVSNEKMEFLFFHIGMVHGCTMHIGEWSTTDDATLLAKSELEDHVNTGKFQINSDQHLLGDCTYPLRPWLITPYQNSTNSSLKDEQIAFNSIQYECLDDIKRTFGLLKGRFRRLNYIDCLKIEAAVKLTRTACIIHNICLHNEDFPDENIRIEIEENKKISLKRNEDSTSEATLKRDILTNFLRE